MTSHCDLCGASEGRWLEARSARSLRSDRRIVPGTLRKIECEACGLVRSPGLDAPVASLYEHDYQVDRADHVFLSADGPRRRSSVIVDWIERLAARGRLDLSTRHVFEIGTGGGYLLSELRSRSLGTEHRGMELGVAAAADARARGLDVTSVPIEDQPSAGADLAIAIAVLEHVSSPTALLRGMRRLLAPGGHAILIQPTQDVQSYDVLFVDHLHHFGVAHIRAYARKCGFEALVDEVGFTFMPNFSAHLLRATPIEGAAWDGAAARTCAAATLTRIGDDLARFSDSVRQRVTAGKRIGVFGLHEAFAVVRAYSTIETNHIAIGLADDPANPAYGDLPFPVVAPEACAASGVQDIFLTMNAVHYAYASARLSALGLNAIAVFQ